MRNSIFYIIILINCWSCQTDKPLKKGNYWNLAMAMESEKATTMDKLSREITYIPLETNDSCLLANRAYLLYADDSNIFIKSNDCLFRFDSNGHFLNRIGKQGMAPSEYARLQSVSMDKDNRRIFCYTGNCKGQYWGYDGDFQKEITLSGEGKTLSQCMVAGDKIVAEQREYTNKGLKITVCFFNLEGDILQEIPLKQDEKVVDINMHTVPVIYTFGDEARYKNAYNSFLLSFTDKPNTEWIFDLGKYEPSREYLEDMNRRETLMREMVQLVDIKESLTHFFLLLVHDYRLRGVVLEKESGLLVYNKEINMPQKGGGIELEEIENAHFWPSFTDNSPTLYGLIEVSSLSGKAHQAIIRHASNSMPITEDSNPMVVKVRL